MKIKFHNFAKRLDNQINITYCSFDNSLIVSIPDLGDLGKYKPIFVDKSIHFVYNNFVISLYKFGNGYVVDFNGLFQLVLGNVNKSLTLPYTNKILWL